MYPSSMGPAGGSGGMQFNYGGGGLGNNYAAMNAAGGGFPGTMPGMLVTPSASCK
jgi:hypothetical protein